MIAPSKTERVLLALVIVIFSGCARTFVHQLDFNPTEPLRVLILPFAEIDQNGEFVQNKANIFIDGVPLVSDKLEATPAELVQSLVQLEFARTSLDLVPPSLVSVELPHHGFAKPDGSFDIKKIFARDAGYFCDKFVDCDAVLFGKVTKWSRAYYGIETVNQVAIDLQLVQASSGRILFRGSGSKSETRGLTKGPTGFSDLVLEPIKGLDSAIIKDLTKTVVQETLAPLVSSTRAEALNTPPPAIFASTHDAADGNLGRRSSLLVLAFGTGKMSASFAIGEVIQNLPMIEREEGHYSGEYFPLDTDEFYRQPVSVSLTDRFGRTTRETVARPLLTLSH